MHSQSGMDTDIGYVDLEKLSRRWWTLVARGAVAIAFGVLVIAAPRISLLALVFLWGFYALADGVFALGLAFRGAREHRSWGWPLFEGIVSIGAGAVAMFWPGITALLLLIVIAVWAIVTGVAEIAAAIELRRVVRGEWLLAVSGLLSIAFGALLLAFPGTGALAIVWAIGAYAVVFGVLLAALGFRVHRSFRELGGVTPKHA